MSPIKYRSVILTTHDLLEPRWAAEMAGAGLNTLLLHAVRLPHDIDELINFRNSDAGRRLSGKCREHGIQVEYQMHTASWLIPRMLFHESPELFRMDLRGNRTSESNFCMSSERAWEIADARAQELAKALPSDTGRYLLFGDDVAQGTCHCPDCAPFTASDQALIFANRLLTAIRRVHPVAQVSYLAYHATLNAPRAVRPEQGVFVEFAPIQRCYRHTIDDPGCAVNRTQIQALDSLLEWFGNVPLHITEYWLDASRHSGWQRPFKGIPTDLGIMQRDIAAYVRMGASSIASYAVGCDADYWKAYGEPPVQQYGRALEEPV